MKSPFIRRIDFTPGCPGTSEISCQTKVVLPVTNYGKKEEVVAWKIDKLDAIRIHEVEEKDNEGVSTSVQESLCHSCGKCLPTIILTGGKSDDSEPRVYVIPNFDFDLQN